jgi:hypothetical protein
MEHSSIHFPACTGPTGLPDLRRWLLRTWDPHGSLHHLDWWIHPTLRNAVLWWIEPDTCELLAAAAPTWPSDATLNLADVPVLSGLAVFAHDLEGTDADPNAPGNVVHLSGLLWGPITLPPRHGGQPRTGIGIAGFSRLPVGERRHPCQLDAAAAQIAAITSGASSGLRILTGTMFGYVGRSDWLTSCGPDEPIPDAPNATAPQTIASMAEDRRLLASLWTLAETTTIVTSSTVTPPRQQARAHRRAGYDPAVRVLSLGGQRVERASTSDPATRNRQHSWIVRPFWRWQPYGSGRSLRRLILIPSHRRGDPALPLLGAERVWRVKPPPDPASPRSDR